MTRIQHTGVVPTISVEVDATAQVYILPVLKMVIDMIGGPIVGLKPYVEGGISIGTEAKCAEHGNPSISAFLNAGFAVRYPLLFIFVLNRKLQSPNVLIIRSLGAEIDIELDGNTIYKHDFDSIGLYSKKEPIATGCVKFSSELDQLQGYYDWVHTRDDGTNFALCYEPLLSGVTWTGTAVPGYLEFFTETTQLKHSRLKTIELPLQVQTARLSLLLCNFLSKSSPKWTKAG